MDILEKILAEILQVYMSYDEDTIDQLLLEPNLARKERVDKIEGLEIIIYSRDHNPPHFHVKTKDRRIDAKFLIETGDYLSGEINSKDLKRINAYYNSPKTKTVMTIIWNKRLQSM